MKPTTVSLSASVYMHRRYFWYGELIAGYHHHVYSFIVRLLTTMMITKTAAVNKLPRLTDVVPRSAQHNTLFSFASNVLFSICPFISSR